MSGVSTKPGGPGRQGRAGFAGFPVLMAYAAALTVYSVLYATWVGGGHPLLWALLFCVVAVSPPTILAVIVMMLLLVIRQSELRPWGWPGYLIFGGCTGLAARLVFALLVERAWLPRPLQLGALFDWSFLWAAIAGGCGGLVLWAMVRPDRGHAVPTTADTDAV